MMTAIDIFQLALLLPIALFVIVTVAVWYTAVSALKRQMTTARPLHDSVLTTRTHSKTNALYILKEETPCL